MAIDDAAAMTDLQRIIPVQIGRYGQPEEVTQLLRYLDCPENSYMIGAGDLYRWRRRSDQSRRQDLVKHRLTTAHWMLPTDWPRAISIRLSNEQ